MKNGDSSISKHNDENETDEPSDNELDEPSFVFFGLDFQWAELRCGVLQVNLDPSDMLTRLDRLIRCISSIDAGP